MLTVLSFWNVSNNPYQTIALQNCINLSLEHQLTVKTASKQYILPKFPLAKWLFALGSCSQNGKSILTQCLLVSQEMSETVWMTARCCLRLYRHRAHCVSPAIPSVPFVDAHFLKSTRNNKLQVSTQLAPHNLLLTK